MGIALLLAALQLNELAAADEHKYQGEPASAWVARLNDPNPSPAMRALRFLGKPAVPLLSEALVNPESPNPVRWNSAMVLGEIGPDAASAVKDLRHAQQDDTNIWVRFYAARSLWKIDKEAEPILKQIRLFASDADPGQLQRAATTAAEMGPDGASTLTDLLNGIKNHPLGEQPDINKARFDAQQQVEAAALAFGDSSIPKLVAALEAPESQVGSVATSALIRFGPKAIKPLITVLENGSQKARLQAIIILAQFQEQGEPAIPALRKALDDPEFTIQVLAAVALWKISRNPDWCLPTLRKAVATLKSRNLVGVLSVLGEIGPPAAPCIRDLDRIANGDDLQLAVAASAALWKIAEDPRVPTLRRALEEKDWLTASTAVATLEAIGKSAERMQAVSAIPDLIVLLSNPLLENNAETALAAFGKDAVDPLINVLKSSENPRARARAAAALASISTVTSRTNIFGGIAYLIMRSVSTIVDFQTRAWERAGRSTAMPPGKGCEPACRGSRSPRPR